MWLRPDIAKALLFAGLFLTAVALGGQEADRSNAIAANDTTECTVSTSVRKAAPQDVRLLKHITILLR